jgi:hypothetical protein
MEVEPKNSPRLISQLVISQDPELLPSTTHYTMYFSNINVNIILPSDFPFSNLSSSKCFATKKSLLNYIYMFAWENPLFIYPTRSACTKTTFNLLVYVQMSFFKIRFSVQPLKY